MSIFISYTRKDEALVRELVSDLGRLGRAAWVDQQIHGGELWWREIIREIQGAEVFVFALSNNSWKSTPCRRELEYADQLGIPVLPVLVGPLESRFVSLAEKQIIDYRGRSADAVVALVAALGELTARPVVLPHPLPEPPQVPFEYLYRIASVMGPNQISPDRQEELIVKLRRNLREEEDEVARADIVKLLQELRDRRELTVQNAKEIDEILSGVEASKATPPEEGATRLPPADHWRHGTPGSDAPLRLPVRDASEPDSGPSSEEPVVAAPAPAPARESEPAHVWEPATKPGKVQRAEEVPGTSPVAGAVAPSQAESGGVPSWLGDILRLGGGAERTTAGQATPPSPAATPQWWSEAKTPEQASSSSPPPISRNGRPAFRGAVLRIALVLALAGLLGVIIYLVVAG